MVLAGRLRDAIHRLNPKIPEEAREDALRKVLRVATPSLVGTNRLFHAMLTRYSICRAFFHGFNWSKWTTGAPAQKLSLLSAGQEHILAAAAKDAKPDDYRQRFLQAVTELSKTFALAVPHEKALEIRDDLSGEIKLRSRKFLIQSKSFAGMLEQAIRKYQNRAIEAVAVIEELIEIAKGMRDADQRGEDLGLTEEERAFYDALADNESAVQAMGSKELRVIATELVTQVRKSVTIRSQDLFLAIDGESLFLNNALLKLLFCSVSPCLCDGIRIEAGLTALHTVPRGRCRWRHPRR